MTTDNPATKEEKLAFSRSKLFFYIFAVIIFLFAVFYFGEIRHGIKLLVRVQATWLLLAFVAQVATYFINSMIMSRLLRTFAPQAHIRIHELFNASIVTLFINQTIPSINLSGNVYFFNFLKKRGVPEHKAYTLLLLALLTFYTAVVFIILALLFICLFLKKIPLYFTFIFLAGIVAFALFAFVIGLLGRGKTVESLLSKLSRIRFLKKAVAKFETIPFAKIKNPWRTYQDHPVIVMIITLLHTSVFLADSFTLYALFHGLGVNVSFLSIFVGFILTKIISLLPFTPGALILYEGSMTLFYVHFGVPVAVAAVVTLLYRILSFWLPIPVGFFLYRKLQHRMRSSQS